MAPPHFAWGALVPALLLLVSACRREPERLDPVPAALEGRVAVARAAAADLKRTLGQRLRTVVQKQGAGARRRGVLDGGREAHRGGRRAPWGGDWAEQLAAAQLAECSAPLGEALSGRCRGQACAGPVARRLRPGRQGRRGSPHRHRGTVPQLPRQAGEFVRGRANACCPSVIPGTRPRGTRWASCAVWSGSSSTRAESQVVADRRQRRVRTRVDTLTGHSRRCAQRLRHRRR